MDLEGVETVACGGAGPSDKGTLAALFSAATTDNGLVRMAEFGRLCHDMVFDREGMAALGDDFVGLDGRSERGDCGVRSIDGPLVRPRDSSSLTGLVCFGVVGAELDGEFRLIELRGEYVDFSGESERSLSVKGEHAHRGRSLHL